MSLDVKRKFLLKNDTLLDILSSWGVVFKSLKVEYFYINSDKFIKTDEKFSCQKDGQTQILSQNDYKNAKKEAKNVIYKQIKSFKLNGNLCNVELYSGDLSGLCILEIIFCDELYGVFFKLPKYLINFVVREVTLESEFFEQNLTPWRVLDECFELGEALHIFKNFSIKPNFPKNLRIKDAVCVFLYSLLLEIFALKDGLEDNFNEHNLLNLYTKFSQSKMMLELFFDIFDEKTVEFFLSNFAKLLDGLKKSIKILKALLFLDELKNAAWFEFFLENAFELEIKNTKNILKNENFLKDFELFLSDTSDFFAVKNFDQKLIISLAKRSRAQALSVIKMAKNLNEQSENSWFFSLLYELKKLEILLSSFNGVCFDGVILERLRKLVKKLEMLKEFDNVLSLIQKLPDDEQSNEQSVKIYTKIYKLRAKVLKSLQKFIHAVLLNSKNLKIYYKVQ